MPTNHSSASSAGSDSSASPYSQPLPFPNPLRPDMALPPPESPRGAEEFRSIPLFCISQAAPRRLVVPAVRIGSRNGRWGVLPLSKQEFGAVWDTEESMKLWWENPLDEGWANAEQEFQAVIDYPIEILQAVLNVLRTGVYDDGTPFSLSRWSFLSKFDVNKLGVRKTCVACNQERWFSPRALYTLPMSLLRFRCADAGFVCLNVNESKGRNAVNRPQPIMHVDLASPQERPVPEPLRTDLPPFCPPIPPPSHPTDLVFHSAQQTLPPPTMAPPMMGGLEEEG